MISSKLSVTIAYLLYNFADAQLPEQSYTRISKWTTITATQPAFTETFTAATSTRPSGQVVVVDGEGGDPGADSPGSTTSTYPATTITQQATTETFPAVTRTYVAPPDALATELLDGFLYIMQDVAPDVTSLPISVASKLNHDYQSLFNSYTSEHPVPTIFTKVNSEFGSWLESNDPATQAFVESVYGNLINFPDATQSASMASALSSLLAPYPSLSSDVEVYLTAMNVWAAPKVIAEISMIRSDLSITTPAPSWLSLASSYLTTSTGASVTSPTISPSTNPSTSPSKGAAAPTNGASVYINAGLAAAGMAVVGLL